MTMKFLIGNLTSLDHHLYSSCKLHAHVDATQSGTHFIAMSSLILDFKSLAGAGRRVYVHKAC